MSLELGIFKTGLNNGSLVHPFQIFWQLEPQPKNKFVISHEFRIFETRLNNLEHAFHYFGQLEPQPKNKMIQSYISNL